MIKREQARGHTMAQFWNGNNVVRYHVTGEIFIQDN